MTRLAIAVVGGVLVGLVLLVVSATVLALAHDSLPSWVFPAECVYGFVLVWFMAGAQP